MLVLAGLASVSRRLGEVSLIVSLDRGTRW
jgi:hypothetical protein